MDTLEQDNPREEASDEAPGSSPEGIEVDWEGLAVAVENQLAHSCSFLHRGTGQVVTLQAVNGRVPAPPDPSEQWLSVPARSSREGYRTM